MQKIRTLLDALQEVRNCGLSAQSGYQWPDSLNRESLQSRAALSLFRGDHATPEDAIRAEAIKMGVPETDLR